MYWDVKTVKALSDYRIYVELEDGRHGTFDLKPYLDRGVMRELRHEPYFRQVGIVFGAVTWPHEQDIAPETLLAGLVPVPEAWQAFDRAAWPFPLAYTCRFLSDEADNETLRLVLKIAQAPNRYAATAAPSY